MGQFISLSPPVPISPRIWISSCALAFPAPWRSSGPLRRNAPCNVDRGRRFTMADMKRELASILSGLEKRVLVYMAGRMPRAVNSDHLTLLGLAGMLGAGLSFWAARAEPLALVGVVLFLALNWFGDSLDGTLARVRKQERPKYGYYVDHVVD